MKPGIAVGLALCAVLAPLTACDTLGLGDDPSVALSFAVAGTSGAGSASLLAVPITDGTNTVDLQNVDVSFDEIVLERSENDVGGDSDGESDVDSDSDGSANETVRRGDFTVALPVDGGVITPINEALPAGRYEKVELDVRSVRLRGTYNGEAFDVTVPVNSELELEFDEDFVVDDDMDRLNVTIAINFANWLRNSSGQLIDPRLLASDTELRAQVVNRIRASFRAFEDSDGDADDEDSDSDSL